jgi:hypothetical protein
VMKRDGDEHRLPTEAAEPLPRRFGQRSRQRQRELAVALVLEAVDGPGEGTGVDEGGPGRPKRWGALEGSGNTRRAARGARRSAGNRAAARARSPAYTARRTVRRAPGASRKPSRREETAGSAARGKGHPDSPQQAADRPSRGVWHLEEARREVSVARCLAPRRARCLAPRRGTSYQVSGDSKT